MSLNFKDKICLMGILNITTDSFFDGNKYFEKNKAIERALEIIEDGADILDIGGESTKPYAIKVSKDEEIERVSSVIGEIRKYKDIKISIDTYKSEVAEEALKCGANIVNDVYGGLYDEGIFEVSRKYNASICITHNRIDNKNKFFDVVGETILELKDRVKIAKKFGIKDEKIILDPGLGLGKYGYNNIKILNKISMFKKLGFPILVGASRKKFLEILNGKNPLEENLSTLVSTSYLCFMGVNILRVHDVKEGREIIDIINSIKGGENVVE